MIDTSCLRSNVNGRAAVVLDWAVVDGFCDGKNAAVMSSNVMFYRAGGSLTRWDTSRRAPAPYCYSSNLPMNYDV